jgi:hypothetical protein
VWVVSFFKNISNKDRVKTFLHRPQKEIHNLKVTKQPSSFNLQLDNILVPPLGGGTGVDRHLEKVARAALKTWTFVPPLCELKRL